MTTIQTPYLEFRELVGRHVRELEKLYPERHSVSWYFLRYLKRVHGRAMARPTPAELDGAMRGFVRFYVDAIDADSALAHRFHEVLDAHRHALRLQRSA